MPRTWRRMRSMLARMSRRRRVGSLEDTDFIPQRLGRDMRLELVPEDHVDPLGQEFLDLADDPGVVEQIDPPAAVELQQQIEIAVGRGLSARRRAEERQMPDAEPPQFFGLALQSTKDRGE